MYVRGSIDLQIKIGGMRLTQEFVVVSDLNRGMILGRDFLVKHQARIYCDLNKLRINNTYVPLDLDCHISAITRSCKTVTLKPQTMYLVDAKIKDNLGLEEGEYTFEPTAQGFLEDQPELKITPGLVNMKRKHLPVQIINTSNKTFRIRKGCVLGKIEQAQPEGKEIQNKLYL